MEKIIKGRAFVLGDNIDTDQIIPAEHLVYSLSDPEESKNYGRFALSGVPLSQSGLPKGGIPFVDEGQYQTKYQIIIGGSNFGCGSSREHAPFALQVAGAKAIIAESYARIFYRNCVDGGFVVPYETSQKLNDKIETGDELELDLNGNTLRNLTKNETYQLRPLGDILPIIEAGNIFEYARQNNMI
ncbi:3-isopropylmalate dehydratase, small subunit, putative [Melioribacter roseus P3M-2]|uniref:3-isopropylmalate dehydratase n=1 Tax=Melioribacter roseus (strain DSM 23840 / JCM 17771 / VKM B-2668 / P3M-2) TaxID=1191523 RepID=I6YSH4_MELRP|nr:3-isopropylmalate dehydratase small subunit [Melioribacter roseus]AFN73477.1 3-isopropylmalate dehydratase, small subunit, putative [Melioribacter roseus P3M-2]